MMRRLILLAAACGVFACALLSPPPQPVRAVVDPFAEVAPDSPCEFGTPDFFGFPFWYKYLKGNNVTDSNGQTVCRPHLRSPNDIWLIGAAVFEMIMILAGIVAVFMIIWGGILYITGRGQPDKLAAAQDTIYNALTGFILTIFSARIIGFITGRFAGGQANSPIPGLPGVVARDSSLSIVLTIFFQLAGALAVIFLIYGGITYARANGDPGTLKQAKNTILYALVGLAVVIFAQVIVSFIFNRLT